MTPERCERCDKPRATRADYDSTAEGEGGHLCWAEWGSSCMLHDWRREALSLRIRAEASMRERDEARAQLAALREAWARYDRSCGLRALQDPGARIALDAAIADTAATAEAHDRRVRAEALREAAKALRKEAGHPEPEDGEVAAGVMRAAGRLLEMAIEIERGGAR